MTETQQQEQELVERAKADKTAFAELYEQYYDKLFHFFYYRTGDEETSYDLTSQTFEKLIKSIRTFTWKKQVPFSAWLFRMARNLLIDHIRRSKLRDYVPLEEIESTHAQTGSDPKAQAEQNLELARVKQGLNRLKPKYRQVLYHKFFDELSNHEIAALLGRKKEQIALEIFRGLKQLRQIIAAQEGGVA
ncbi:MAG TPA: RNA polymerase sigma factor [bacterium]|nr:RNA polymerase sigma factor [bacterium]